jgi:aromatic ring-cleaving dioxygenase
MTDAPAPISAIRDWHAHVYYDDAGRDHAARLRDWVEQLFAVRMGRWHDVPVGPHPQAMYQIAFAREVFATLVPFLALNRSGLTILVHPDTDRPRDDHLRHAIWLGAVLTLNADILPETAPHG